MTRLGIATSSDLEWWRRHCETWNGTARMLTVTKARPEFDVSIVSNVSAESFPAGNGQQEMVFAAGYGSNCNRTRLDGMLEKNITIK